MTEGRLLIATSNRGKVREIRDVLRDLAVRVLTPEEIATVVPDYPETGSTFRENAVGKAEHWAAVTGLACLADDSGLCVDALDGAPGVLSARFAGSGASDRDNNDLLLEKLREVPDSARGAEFVCCLALAAPGWETVTFEGRVRGEILRAPDGEGGFGYDPLFYYPELGRSFGSLEPERKNRVSHRARALRVFREWLERDGLHRVG